MTGRMQLSNHAHSWRYRPHKHTSYPGLLFILMITGVILLGASIGAQGAVQNPQTGSVGLSGTVAGPPPSVAAVITSPTSGSHTTSSPITITGTCPNNTFVFIDKNSVLAGQAACNGGRFSLQADLFIGANTLIARVIDALGQSGPDSNPTIVYYDAPNTNASGSIVGRQMFLESDATVVGGSPGTSLSRSITIVGGTAPFAVSWDFGDGGNSLMTVGTDGKVSASHSYASPGTYEVIVKVSDSLGNEAFIQLITVVNGPVPGVSGTTSSSGGLPGKLMTDFRICFSYGSRLLVR
jgi:hypothetical protein